ncbi:MAG: prepilin-type N-terminal cleavage/methylation domain-containing protein [Deltaproteobacteria bacterium]|nr:MAG: prepilin-type N-terminal cleavage/methylation domain-containing protein [Deltaproteobacteria bacterium]
MLPTRYTDVLRSVLRRSRSCRGVTLVELMVVTAILGVVVGAVYSLLLPVQKSTYTQSRVVDMQDTMRLALDRMTRDVRMAGLLVGGNAITGPGGVGAPTATSFTIRTRSLEGSGARIVSTRFSPPALYDPVVTPNLPVAPLPPDTYRVEPPILTGEFSSGETVRLYDAVVPEIPLPAGSDYILTIVDVAGNDGDTNNQARFNDNLVTFNPNLNMAGIDPDVVLYMVKLSAPPPPALPNDIQFITYTFNPNDNDPALLASGGPRATLRRIINGVLPGQILFGGDPPRGADLRKTFDVTFAYPNNNQVDIVITGRTEAYNPNAAAVGDGLADAKTRILRATAVIRNDL